MNSQEAYLEWVDAVKLRESIEYELCNALSMRQWRRIREIRRWLAEARSDRNEALAVYKRLRAGEKQGVMHVAKEEMHADASKCKPYDKAATSDNPTARWLNHR